MNDILFQIPENLFLVIDFSELLSQMLKCARLAFLSFSSDVKNQVLCYTHVICSTQHYAMQTEEMILTQRSLAMSLLLKYVL